VSWQLELRIDRVKDERREFADSEAGYREAQQAGGVWVAQHGVDSTVQWVVEASQALQQTTWDEDYRREVGRRISLPSVTSPAFSEAGLPCGRINCPRSL
jgi:hypothetical protein